MLLIAAQTTPHILALTSLSGTLGLADKAYISHSSFDKPVWHNKSCLTSNSSFHKPVLTHKVLLSWLTPHILGSTSLFCTLSLADTVYTSHYSFHETLWHDPLFLSEEWWAARCSPASLPSTRLAGRPSPSASVVHWPVSCAVSVVQSVTPLGRDWRTTGLHNRIVAQTSALGGTPRREENTT